MENEKETAEQINEAEKDQTQETTQEQPTAEKTFTQEEVNRIVQERLARVKNSEKMKKYNKSRYNKKRTQETAI